MISNKIIFLIIFFLLWNVATPSQTVKIISPNGGELLQSGERYSISWISANTNWLKIEYRVNETSEWNIITNKISAHLGSYSWKVPNTSTKFLQIRISDNVIYDISDNYSRIQSSLNKINKITNSKEVNTIRIMPLGNSITFDNRKNDTRLVEDKIGYRYPLYNFLNSAGYKFSFIGSEHSGSNFFSPATEFDRNAGFPGLKDDQLATLLKTGRRYQPQNSIDQIITPGRYLNTYPTDIILLHIGTNGNDLPDGTNSIDIENILDEVDRYEDSTGTQIIVFLAKIIDRSPQESYVTTLNNNIENMVLDRINNPANDAYPDNIVLVDMQNISGYNYTISPDPNGSPGDMNDQLHPNDKGYTKIATNWFNALQSYLGSLPEITMQPKNTAVIEGDNAQFKVSVYSVLPLSFQWKENGIDISSATDSILNVINTEINQDSNFYSCSVSNTLGFVESKEVYLFVTPLESRVTSGIRISYDFNEQFGTQVNDLAGLADPINFIIQSSNTTNWTPSSLELTSSSNISATDGSSKLFSKLNDLNELSFELWLKPSNVIQNGPARILTYSKNKFERNFGLMQNGSTYEFRLRTTSTDNNGLPSLSSSDGSVHEVLTHIVYTLSKNDTAKIYLNGVLENKTYIENSFDNWDSTYFFGIGNEFVDNKPWLGALYFCGIFDRELSKNEIQHNYLLGIDGITNEIISPNNLSTIFDVSAVKLNWDDNSDNETKFIIKRKDGLNFGYTNLIELNTNEVQYSDNSIVDGVKYSYVVVAANNNGESDLSNLAYFTTLLPAPGNLSGVVNIDDNVELSWNDLSNNEMGFIIEGKPNHIDSVYYVIDTVAANVSFYVDTKPKLFTPFLYRVYSYNADVVSEFSNVVELNVVDVYINEHNIPDEYSLSQNYPNPFNPSTIIQYALPQDSEITISIFNVLGQKMVDLIKSSQGKGTYRITFDGSNINSGVYFYQLEAKGKDGISVFREVKKLLLIK